MGSYRAGRQWNPYRGLKDNVGNERSIGRFRRRVDVIDAVRILKPLIEAAGSDDLNYKELAILLNRKGIRYKGSQHWKPEKVRKFIQKMTKAGYL